MPITPITGSFLHADPHVDVSVDLRLGYREDERQVEELLSLHQAMLNDPGAQRLYDESKRFALWSKVMGIKGYKNPTELMNDPAQLDPPQPDPLQQAELALKQAEAKAKEAEVQLKVQSQQFNQQLEQMKVDMEQRFKTMQYMLDVRTADRQDAETQNRIDTAIAELQLAKETAEKSSEETTKTSAIISPNS